MTQDTPAPLAPSAAPPAKRSALRRVVLLAFGLAFGLGAAECGARLLVRDGEILGLPLVPYAPPRERGGPEDDGAGYIRYDAEIGWAPGPLAADPTGQYFSDQFGLRAPAAEVREYGDAPRVVIYGDSFAHSDEVSYGESLAAALQEREDGLLVLTAGVPAFGTDQAYLRYLATRDVLHPRVVVIGVHQHDFLRNAELWTKSGYSKPRFVETAGGALSVVNRPPLAGPAFQRVFESFETWEFAPLCYLHVPGIYDARATDVLMSLRCARSVLARTAEDARRRTALTPGCTNEVHRISELILRAFIDSAVQAGSSVVVVTLPSATHLVDLKADRDWWTATLERAVAGTPATLLDLTPPLLAAVDSGRLPFDRMYTKGGVGHFTGEGNALVADLLTDAVRDAAAR